jgi:hypothetical protein
MTPSQQKMARHALGLDGERKRSYRNRYYAALCSSVEDEWNDLCRRGLAERGRDGSHSVGFFLTEEGARAALLPGEILDPEDFPTPQESASE